MRKGDEVVLARIKFTTTGNSNRLTKAELTILEDFLGETLQTTQLKIGEDGKPESKSWKESFDEKDIEKNPDYVLVDRADMYELYTNETYIVDLENFTTRYPSLEFTIKGIPKSIGQDNTNLLEEMQRVADKIEDAKNRFDKVVEFNQSCNVHVPNLGLLNINRLAFATDICTEELQQILLKGWRIIAVCPQPDQRRPDYILGMSVTDVDGYVGVEHFSGNGREGSLAQRDIEKANI